MNTTFSRFLATLVVLSFFTTCALAQQGTPSQANDNYLEQAVTPMPAVTSSPLTATGHSYWGFDLGITGSAYEGNQNFLWHIADPYDFDPNPLYPNNNVNAYLPFSSLGSGAGFLLGIKAAFPLSQSLDIEGKLRYLTNYTSSTETQSVVLAADPSTHEPTVTSNATSSYSLLLSNLSFAALLNVALSDQFYAIGGIEYSTLLNNSITAHQDLADGNTYYYSGTPDQSTLSSVDHPASSEPGYFTSSRTALQLGAGTAFGLSDNSSTMLDLELLVSIPFTQWLQGGLQTHLNNVAAGYFLPAITFPKLWYASLTVGIRFPFGHSEAEPADLNSSADNGEQGIGSDGKVALTGTVTDSKTGSPVDATMTVVDLTNNQVVATGQTDDGKYNMRVKAPGKYSVTADANGYLFGTAYFQVDNQGRILSRDPNIKLSGTSGGHTRLLVFFNTNSATLDQSSYPELNRAVHLMKAVPSMQVQIAGYTDSVGADSYNLQLSQRRADAVRNYIIQNGVAANRVTAQGYGKASPVADNGTEDGRAENRRVEFVVLSN